MESIARCFVYDFLRGGKFGIASRVAQHLTPFWAKQNVPAQELKFYLYQNGQQGFLHGLL
jgi:hypothetical protein